MPALLLAAIEYGSYVSIVKFVIFVLLFFAWLPMIAWVYKDAARVKTRQLLWSWLVFGVGAGAFIIWLMIPIFFIGFLFFIIGFGATTLAYIMHRNTKVPAFERILTTDYFKNLMVNEEKKLAAMNKGLVFVTANGNEVVTPEPKTPEFFGFMLANEIFDDAIWRRAEQIILLPSQQGYNVLYSIDGVAIKQAPRSREDAEYFIYFLKHLADLDLKEKRKPQRGRFKIRKDENPYTWEVNMAGSTAGEQVKLKQSKEEQNLKLSDIGANPDQVKLLENIREKESGVFLVTGTKNTGVTSTFYAMLSNHDPFLTNINTLEKTILHDMPNITQNLFSLSDTGTTSYAQKLGVILRTGPDVIGVADCDDTQTATVISNAAKNGDLIYVSIEATNVAQAIGKWISLVQDKDIVAKTLIGVTSQRLLRKLCEKCRQAYEPNQELLKKFNLPADKVKRLYRQGKAKVTKRDKPTLCEKCQGTGFFGRTGVFETIIMNEELKINIIKASKTLPEIATNLRRARMLFMQEQAIRKVVEGVTSINEVIREFSSSQKKKKPKQKKAT